MTSTLINGIALKDITVIHVLRFGVAYCKRAGLPYEWPINETFIAGTKTPSAEEKRKLCVHCVAAQKKAGQDQERIK